MAKPIKTNVLRHLDAHKIPYETREYDVSDENYDGKLVADKVGLPAEMIYKTLVLTGDKTPHLVCVVPVEKELDLKAVARATGNKSVAMLPQKDLLPLTGYLRGGCSPIGMKKAFPTFIQQDAQELTRISVSAGVRGCQVILSVEALVGCTGAAFADLCRA
jgi:Cys-tRNA(Pro)/Cys-tRNA(Cys) deacylase